MDICVIGTGYVGLVTGTCFAEMGNHVICVDHDNEKINKLNNGTVPIWEPGLEEMVKRNREQERLFFTTNIHKAVVNSDICFIAVGTPPDEDGSADLQYVLAVAKDIANFMNEYKIIVNKSTVPVGTADMVKNTIQTILNKRKVKYDFDVISNPEFLKEGDAINDSMKPDRVIIGTHNLRCAETMEELYKPFVRASDRFIVMSLHSAEMTKYTANAMLATKISFMNDIARICELVNADINEVRHGIGSDSRIGYKFIYPGVGYGGSCFPKDVKALIKIAEKEGIKARVLQSVEDVNNDQKRYLAQKVINYFGEDLHEKLFAIWGLSFKPNTDDLREAPSIDIIKILTNAGAKIRAYDPVAMFSAKKLFVGNKNIEFCKNNYEALKGSDALLLITEWNQFRDPDFYKMKALLKRPVIFDGRNQYNIQEMKRLGFKYYAIGRPVI